MSPWGGVSDLLPSNDDLSISEEGTTILFANSKGGVGKSTLALIASLGVATRYPEALVQLVDLDKQSTSSDALNNFANSRFEVVNAQKMLLDSGLPNNANISKHINAFKQDNQGRRFLVFDSPAGTEPLRSSFILKCDFIFVPLSVGDADIHATHKFLDEMQELFHYEGIPKDLCPKIIVLPNMIDTRSDFDVIRRNFIEYQIYLGRGLFFLNSIRRAFRRQGTDTNLHVIFEQSKDYWMWLTDLISGKENLLGKPDKVLQL